MIGDSLEADIEGAFNVGMDAILFNESKQNRSASGLKVVDYLKDLKTYL
jgi:putative hydrolase of the HAD superfamily